MIFATSAFEAYILNPRIVSSYLELPISLTFLILVISEHIFGVVGLLIGVPLFYIAVELFKDLDGYITKVQKVYGDIKSTQRTVKKLKQKMRMSRSQKQPEE